MAKRHLGDLTAFFFKHIGSTECCKRQAKVILLSLKFRGRLQEGMKLELIIEDWLGINQEGRSVNKGQNVQMSRDMGKPTSLESCKCFPKLQHSWRQ